MKIDNLIITANHEFMIIDSSNILLDLYYRAKVADFGLSKPMPPLPPEKSYVKVTSFRGTRGYTADEYLDGELSTKLDVFSFGVVCYIDNFVIVKLHTVTLLLGCGGNVQWQEGI